MAWGDWALRFLGFGFLGLAIGFISAFYPAALQQLATDLFGHFESSLELQLWTLYGVFFTVMTFFLFAAAYSIRAEARAQQG